MRCETTSSVKECALRARSGDVHVARVVPLVVDAVVGLTLGLIAHVVVVVFVVAILHRIFCIWKYTLHTARPLAIGPQKSIVGPRYVYLLKVNVFGRRSCIDENLRCNSTQIKNLALFVAAEKETRRSHAFQVSHLR